MKTISILVLVMFASVISFGQEKKQELKEITVTPPQFTGVNDAAKIYGQQYFSSFENYLKENLKYPESIMKNGANGTEVIHFEVSANGMLTDFKVINSVSPEIDAAIYDMLKTTCGMWKPGESNGNPTSMKKEISIAFKWKEFEELGKTKDFLALANSYLKKGNRQLIEKNNPKKALKYFNSGIKYKPNEGSLLLARGMCKYELGDKEGALKDWDRMRIMGVDKNTENLASNFSELKGYSELAFLLDK